jgi:hypothetical protein
MESHGLIPSELCVWQKLLRSSSMQLIAGKLGWLLDIVAERRGTEGAREGGGGAVAAAVEHPRSRIITPCVGFIPATQSWSPARA